MIGDLNAKIGQEIAHRPVIGTNSLHVTTNNNGSKLIDFAASKNMIIGGTLFPHKEIHKATWKSPDGRTSNQIDHVLIDARHISNLMDVRSYRGANVDSDHYLLATKIRARIANTKKDAYKRKEKINIELLTSNKHAQLYEREVTDHLKTGNLITEHNVEKLWTQFKTALSTAAENSLGKSKPKKRKDWFDDECQTATDTKNKAYKAMLQRHNTRIATEEYKEKRRQEKRIHKAKKRQYEQHEVDMIESNSNQHNTRRMYQQLNHMRKDFKPRITTCKAKDGTILSDKASILNRWVEHFNELLNSNNHADEDTPIGNVPVCTENIALPTLDEIKSAIRKLKNNKSPGSDALPSELFKHGGPQLHQILHHLITCIWQTRKMPYEWTIGAICPLHKKGDQLECSNYRGITLLNVAYKILSNVLCDRLQPYVDNIIGKYQCGFRRGKGTSDQIHSLRQILEKTMEFNIETHHLFIDFKAAYDSILRQPLYGAMLDFGIPEKLVDLVRMTMDSVTSYIKIQSDESLHFGVENGLRQGDALACMLFNIALEKAIRDSGINTSGTIYHKSVQVLAYADDIDIIGRSSEDVKNSFILLERAAKKMGLSINETKTKYMISAKHQYEMPNKLDTGEHSFERVDNFVYLGSLITSSNLISEEIKRRVLVANRCYYGLHKHLKSHRLQRKTKLSIYKTLIRPVLMYASETWTLSKKDEEFLNVFERKVLRKILGAVQDGGTWRRRYNFELYAIFNEPEAASLIKISRMRWAGHILRMDAHDPTHKLTVGNPEGRRTAGRPKLRWLDGVGGDMRVLKVKNWREKAKNKSDWRKIVEKAKAHKGL